MRSVLAAIAAVAALCAGLGRSATVSKPIWPQRGYDATRHARSPYQGPSNQPTYSTPWMPTPAYSFSDFPGKIRGGHRC
jgi:hypothetical protein